MTVKLTVNDRVILVLRLAYALVFFGLQMIRDVIVLRSSSSFIMQINTGLHALHTHCLSNK